MYKLCMALGWSVIKSQLQIDSLRKYSKLWDKLDQHRFITSKNIDAYYSKMAKDEGLKEEYEAFISSKMYYDSYLMIDDKYCDISGDYNKDISKYLKNRCKYVAIVICEENELNITRSSCRFQYTIDEASQDDKGPLGIYSVVASFFADENDEANKYLSWIRNIVSGEKEISIIDPYILQARNVERLIDYGYPIFPRGCVLHLHVPADAECIERAIEGANPYNINVKIHKYKKMNHDRYIITSDRIIILGLGMDFMKKERGRLVVREGFNFTLKQKPKNTEPMKVENRLAGTLAD